MKRIKLYSPVETVEVEVGGNVAELRLDLSKERLADVADACIKAKSKVAALDALAAKADDKRGRAEIDRKVSKAIEPAVRLVLGDSQFEEVMELCGCDGSMGAGTRNLVVLPLLALVMECIAERNEIVNGSKETIGTIAARPEGDEDALRPDGD